eukprot:Pgem_evm1s12160
MMMLFCDLLSNAKHDDGTVMIESFQTLPSKEELPDYYDVIEEPMDMHTIQ